MDFLKKNSHIIWLLCFFASIFFLTLIPPDDYDILFHIKAGEAIMKNGIFHHDIFSFSAQGREWYPYEWLFQITVYRIVSLFGLESLRIFVVFFATATIALVYRILRTIFALQKKYALLICFFFFVSEFDFFVPRPHLVANLLLLLNLYILLLLIYKNKNYLIITLPITVIWANIHGSIILDLYLFWSMSFIAFIQFSIDKSHKKKQNLLLLLIFSTANSLLTILPPLGFLQYRLLWYFIKNSALISHFMKEWNPLIYTPGIFLIYSASAVLSIICFIWVAIKSKKKVYAVVLLPLFPFIVMPFFAQRNLNLAYVSICLLLGWSAQQIQHTRITRFTKQFSYLLIICFLIFYSYVFIKKTEIGPSYIPKKAVSFIKKNHFNGNLFHEFDLGSYLLYELYPQQKIFTDIRFDLYACCEIKDLHGFALNKNMPRHEYAQFANHIFNKYHISYALLQTKENTVFRTIAEILSDDPHWHLVYWDDLSAIFVKDDGKNKTILTRYKNTAATPILDKPYRENMMDVAFLEYQRMTQIADSAKSRNSLGLIMLHKKQYEKAAVEFEKAVVLDPTFESPYMNLGELAAKDGNYSIAIDLYKKALQQAPNRGFISTRLHQLIDLNSRTSH